MVEHAQLGIRLREDSQAASLACPFLPPKRWEWDGEPLSGHAEWFQLRPGLGYIYLDCRLEGPSQCYIDLEGECWVLGYVTRGWAKWTRAAGEVEKIEAGQWFTMPRSNFSIDRTESSGVTLGLCICSRAMAEQLSELSGHGQLREQLRRFARTGEDLGFQGGQMEAATFNLARQIAADESQGLKRRLQIESNTLAWIAETLSQVEASGESSRASSLNAADRDAVAQLCEQMRHDPSYEYSMEELCKFSGLNEHKLKSAFKMMYGKTTFGYLRELRMDHAAALLKQDRLSVIQVANEVGYANASHFARAFKTQHGLLPKAYQCLHRQGGSFSCEN
jgi:AraC-like DNA-binding protein